MIVDGKRIAEDIYTQLEAAGTLRGTKLGVVVCEPNAVIESFVRIKQKAAERLGIELVRADVARDGGTAGVLDAMARLVPQTQGIIVQLPLPPEIDVDAVLAALPGTHDVDGIGREPRVMPPVARAAADILREMHVGIGGKRAVVIGAGRLVGAPVAKMLEAEGAEVQVLTKEGGSLDVLARADIIVSGAGEPGMITLDMIRNGVVLIDAGTSEQGGKVRGDADPACASKCAVFTPVPGGVGPVAVAEIFANLYFLHTT
jgi:methylenetetrahydrofolate dehydrogenase (NADP+)/methenyltetrahydrofolate cyclohydrolase